MINPPINRKCALINLGIISLLVADSFILKPTLSRELFDESSHKYVPEAGRGGRAGHTNFYIYSTTGRKYKIPEETYLELSSVRDSFYIYKTGIFRKSLKIEYQFENSRYLENIGMLNSAWACKVFLIYAACISLLNLFSFLIIPHQNFNQILLFIGLFLSLATLVIYFWWNT